MQNQDTKPAAGLSTRREFIKKTSTAVAAGAAAMSFPYVGKALGANDRISIAVIGLGAGIGQNHLTGLLDHSTKNNTQIAAVCDIFKPRLEWGKKTAADAGQNADAYDDYRKVLERKDIDSVLVATHDVWHAPISIQAMEAGKHVYCEKPMSRYMDEAFKVYDAVKKYNKVFQVGAQGCSMPAWKVATDLVKAGKCGTLVWAQGYYCRNSKDGEWNDAPYVPDYVAGSVVPGADSPANINWDMWQGQVKNKVAFDPERFHRWRKYFPYCAGVLGDLVPHRLHPLMLASGDPQFPSRVVSIGTHNINEDGTTFPNRQVPEHQQFIAEFPSGYVITLTASTVVAKSPGFVIYGHKAVLNIGEGGNQVDLVPERPFADDIDPEQHDGLTVEDADIRMHEKNFFDCIRTPGMVPNTNIDLAVRVQTVISLAEMSNRLNTMCLFDEKTRTVTNGEGKKITPLSYGTSAES